MIRISNYDENTDSLIVSSKEDNEKVRKSSMFDDFIVSTTKSGKVVSLEIREFSNFIEELGFKINKSYKCLKIKNNQMKNKIPLVLLSVFLIGFISASQVCQVYDDFSFGSLDISRWDIRQDVEGQPLMEEYWIDPNLENFHTQQNAIGDRRVYLVPKHNFTTGDSLEYDFDVISKEGNYMQMNLLTGDQYIRVGIMGFINGVQGYDESGVSHIKIEFQENNLHLERTSPSNVILIDNLPLTNANGTYELYIGSVFTNSGHIDYDNFKLCEEQEELSCEVQLNELKERVSFLESLVERLQNYLWFLKNPAKKQILCDSLEETGGQEMINYGMHCWIKDLKKKEVCKCEKV